MQSMDVTVIKSKRRTLVLTVTGEKKLVVRAPLSASDREIEEFIARHRRWIAARLAANSPSLPSLENGTALVLFGRSYTVAEGRARLQGETLFLPAENREKALAALLKRLTASYMGELTRRLAAQYGFRYASVRVTSARTRWGSCGRNGNISYSFRNAFLPAPAAEYIVLHELCHTRYFNHSANFWHELEGILPDYAARRKLVRSYEWAMKFL